MLHFATHFASLFQPVMLPIRFLGACSVLSLCTWSLASFIMDAVARAKEMHQIPCTKCRFFTGDYRLKCTTNPHIANTEQAIGCPDYYEIPEAEQWSAD
ncbi:MAG: hypothetical protein ACRC2S_06970 [Waterburya sp.]